MVSEETFQKHLQAAEGVFRPILLVAYDQGLRKGEILGLRWEQLDVREGVIRLAPQDTKGGEHRVVYLTARTLEALRALPRRLHAEHVFHQPCHWRALAGDSEDVPPSLQRRRPREHLVHDLRRYAEGRIMPRAA